MLLLLHSRVNMLPALVGLMLGFTRNGLRRDIKHEELSFAALESNETY